MCETPLAVETIPLERGSVWGDLLSLKVPYYAHFNVDTIVWGVYSKMFKKKQFSQTFYYSTSFQNNFCFSHIPDSLTMHTHTVCFPFKAK